MVRVRPRLVLVMVQGPCPDGCNPLPISGVGQTRMSYSVGLSFLNLKPNRSNNDVYFDVFQAVWSREEFP